jgi:hypothetical protein
MSMEGDDEAGAECNHFLRAHRVLLVEAVAVMSANHQH